MYYNIRIFKIRVIYPIDCKDFLGITLHSCSGKSEMNRMSCTELYNKNAVYWRLWNVQFMQDFA